MRWPDRLNDEQKRVLTALLEGSRLKSHRYLDGEKVYRLHPLDTDVESSNGESIAVPVAIVDALKARGLIESNMKFPAATYLLTPEGERVAASLVSSPLRPLTTRPSHSR